MRLARLYLHALRAARPRQLARRATRPLRRRLTRSGVTAGSVRSLPEGVELWRSPAFANAPLEDGIAATRLHGFHSHYGEDVLAAARAGDTEAGRQAAHEWIAGNPPRAGDAWHPYPLSTRVGNWVAALSLDPSLATAAVAESLGAPARLSGAQRRGRHPRQPRDPKCPRARPRWSRARRCRSARTRHGAAAARAPGAGPLRRRPLRAQPGLPPRRPPRPARGAGRLGVPAGSTSRSSGCSGSRPGSSDPTGRRRSSTTARSTSRRSSTFRSRRLGCRCSRRRGTRCSVSLVCGSRSTAARLPLRSCRRTRTPTRSRSSSGATGVRSLSIPGTSTYEPGAQRDLERSTAAHSTIALDGRSQFELWGAFRSGPLPRVRLLGTEPLARGSRLAVRSASPADDRLGRTGAPDRRRARPACTDAGAQLAAAGCGRRGRRRGGRRAASGDRGAIRFRSGSSPSSGVPLSRRAGRRKGGSQQAGGSPCRARLPGVAMQTLTAPERSVGGAGRSSFPSRHRDPAGSRWVAAAGARRSLGLPRAPVLPDLARHQGALQADAPGRPLGRDPAAAC